MLTAERMAAVDANAAALGVPRRQLMESSGAAVARAVRDVASGSEGGDEDDGTAVALVCGRGNNGGDAFVAARFLSGLDPTVHLLGRPTSIRTDIARENWAALERAEIDARVVRDAAALDLGDPDAVVDAMLGTGATGAPREPEATAIRRVNAADATVVSVDVPSGVDANTGTAAGAAVDPDRIVTFHDAKPGLADLDAPVAVADIGIPEAAERFTGPGDLLGLDRSDAGHKGDHGAVLVIGGGPYTGAPALSAQAALRAGADLVRVAVPESVAREVQGYDESLIVRPHPGDRLAPPHVDRLLKLAADHDAVVVGPGAGDDDATLEAVRRFVARFDGRAVVDADALAAVPDAVREAGGDAAAGPKLICTPHAGELAGMGGPALDAPRADVDRVRAFAADLEVTLLAKGRHDVITDGGDLRINRTGNPGMTVGGTGDVLAGAVGALACRLPPLPAAAAAAYAVGGAGDAAVAAGGENGLLPTDLLGRLPAALEADG